MKRIICILLAFIVSIPICAVYPKALDKSVVLSVSSVTIDENSTEASVDISIDNNIGIAAADIMVKSDLKIKKIYSNVLPIFFNVDTGRINWSYSKNNYKEGSIITIVFEIPDDLNKLEYPVELNVIEIIDEDLNDLECKVNNGSISINRPIYISVFKIILDNLTNALEKIINILRSILAI